MSDEQPTEQPRGLARARALLAKVDAMTVMPETVPVAAAIATHALAIATVELAAATQLAAITAALKADEELDLAQQMRPEFRVFRTDAELEKVVATVRSLLGLGA